MKDMEPSPVSPYEFTSDWFSWRASSWEKHFIHLAGCPIQCLEIGSFEGRSAIWVVENLLSHPASRLTCIDIFYNAILEDRFERNIYATGRGERVVKLKGPSWRHLRPLPLDTFDLIYIDGSHHGRDVIEDAILCFRLLKSGGFLIFDDYRWAANPTFSVYPKDAIDAFLHLFQDQIDILHLDWLVILQKR